jgi:hypothetical protein
MMINYKQSSICFGLSSEFFEFDQIISCKSRMPLFGCAPSVCRIHEFVRNWPNSKDATELGFRTGVRQSPCPLFSLRKETYAQHASLKHVFEIGARSPAKHWQPTCHILRAGDVGHGQHDNRRIRVKRLLGPGY